MPIGSGGRSALRMASMSRVRLSLLVVPLLALSALVLFTLFKVSGPHKLIPLEPLSSPAGWETVEGFFASPGPQHRLDAPREVREAVGLQAWRSYTPETGSQVGRIVSRPFEAPAFLAVPYVGFPGELPGNRVALRCDLSGAELEVASRRTNNQWTIGFMDLRGFCQGPVRLIATNMSPATYVGIATPFAADSKMWFANTQPGPRLLAALATWLAFAVVGLGSVAILLRLAPAVDPIATAIVGVGVLGMVLLLLFTLGPALGKAGVWAAFAAAALILMFDLINHRARMAFAARRAAGPLLAWLGVSLVYVSLVAIPDSGGGSWAINGLFTPVRWSSDNQLPMMFAEALHTAVPRHQISKGGPWLVTDRGPLMAALLTIPRELLGVMAWNWGSQFDMHTYMVAATVIQASWVLLVPLLATRISLQRPGWLLIALAASPFMLFNTIYAWPKLLGAIYVVICCALLFGPGAKQRLREHAVLPLVGVAASLAYLAHASNAFALVPVAAVAAPAILGAGIQRIAIGGAVAVLVAWPWLWWQAAIQPQANALLRYALANDFGLERRGDPIWPDVVAYYRALGWDGWLSQKADAVRLLLGLPHQWMNFPEVGARAPVQPPFGAWRVGDFFSLARAIGVVLLAVPLTLVAYACRWHTARGPFVFIFLGLLGVMFAVLTTVPPAWVHQLPYGAILLLLLGLLMLVDSLPKAIAWPLPLLAVGYCLLVWIAPAMLWADRVAWSGLVGVAAGVSLAALAVTMFDDATTGDIADSSRRPAGGIPSVQQ